MVNWKKMAEDRLASLTEEERQRLSLLKSLREENVFFKGTVRLENDKRVVFKEDHEVQVYKQVLNKEVPEVRDILLISFGGYREFQYDKRMIENYLDKCKVVEHKCYCIDAGHAYVVHEDMLRIFRDSILALKGRGMTLVDDYSSDLRQNDMGKMLEGMGLI